MFPVGVKVAVIIVDVDARAEATMAYWEHVESCWYVGSPGWKDGRGCMEHNRLYDAWWNIIIKLTAVQN